MGNKRVITFIALFFYILLLLFLFFLFTLNAAIIRHVRVLVPAT